MKDLIIIKIGGQAISELTDDFFEQLAVWRTQGKKILLLHGGGPLITKLCQQLQVPVVKKAGVRVTDAQTLALTKLVLLGQAQPLLLQKLSDHQLPVVGLNAADNQMLVGKYLDQSVYGEVGTVVSVNQDKLLPLLDNYIGVLAPLAMTPAGNWLNVNADQAAADVASLLGAKKLYLMTDVAGVLNQHHLIPHLTKLVSQKLVAEKIISSGMQPKIKAAFAACTAGVEQVAITNCLQNPGTIITKE
ncbi:acetylglutamate kinase [Limosilactobacillus mucosae]|jgi:acetylglutamate kinase|uniref:acetylglutamate kinase n=1 Tax=Limosilactobacillus mucosae TaxID=97478 RepID=UPI0022E29BA0|nr:acetylglutamate kinase [Limosilactobacillus mucosae]